MSVTSASRDINQLHPAAQVACRLFLQECKKSGIDIFITETYRSQARQVYLYAQGRTRPGQVVTWTLNSNHKSKLAWDIAVSPPKSLYDVSTLNRAGAIARKLGITWGGDWRSTIDRPYLEVKTNWKGPVGIANNSNDEIKELQAMLNQVGFKLSIDGIEGKSTLNAIQIFQRRSGLIVDGIGGKLTLEKLKEVIALSEKEGDKLELNRSERLELSRIFKHARGNGVFSSAEHERSIVDGKMTISRFFYLQGIIAGASLNGGKRI